MVREFKLVNEKGQEYSLMDIEKHCLLTEPEGLGYSYATEYEQLGNTFIENFRRIEQGQIQGTVNFLKYDNFKEFVDFIERTELLKIAYKIPFEQGTREYFKDINIQSLSKTQKQTNGVISENITFDCLSLWYEQNEIIFKVETYEDEMRYSYKWNSRYINYNSRAIQFDNKGHIEAPFKAEIDGYVKNPAITILIDKEEYVSIKVPITINEYEKLLYSSRAGEIYIQKQNSDGTKENLWKKAYIDITKQNILKLPIRII